MRPWAATAPGATIRSGFALEAAALSRKTAAAAQDRARPVDLGRDIAMVRAARFGGIGWVVV